MSEEEMASFAASIGPLPSAEYRWVHCGRYGHPSLELVQPFQPVKAVIIARTYDAWYYGPQGGRRAVCIGADNYEQGLRWGYALLMLGVENE
jgi:hypothetical protein